MKLSVNIVTRGRLNAFKKCCQSVARSLPEDSEVLILINGPDPEARAFLEEFSHSAFRWQSIRYSSLSQARNIAWELSRGDILYCIDDDVEVPEHLFHTILERFDGGKESVIGGPNLTPPHSHFWPIVFGAIMQNPFIAPFVCHRYGAPVKHRRPVGEFDLMFCNLAIHTQRTPEGLRFHNHLRSNEENTFISQLQQQDGSCRFDSDLYVYHQRRDTIFRFLSQIKSYGYGRAQQMLLGWRTSYGIFLVPSVSLLLGLSLLFLHPKLLGGLALIHLLLCFFYSLKVAKRLSLTGLQIFAMAPIGGLVHLAYGLGLLQKVAETLLIPIKVRARDFLLPVFSWRVATRS